MRITLLMGLIVGVGCQSYPDNQTVKTGGNFTVESDTNLQKNYSELCQRIAKTTKKKSLEAIPAFLETCLRDSVFAYWYDTPWNFYGTTEEPRKGNIACGYFVTTTLKHLGLNIDRVYLAQQASSVLIKEVCDTESIKVFSNSHYENMKKYVKEHSGNIFIAGLDNHVGFIVKEGTDMYFVHASGISPYKVVKEKIDDANLLVYSKYHMVGHLNFKNWARGLKNS
ncbi:MAG TPA: hypothetical protein VK177_02965 [Flavobacteriales bacterium]|nr:hypothetical protein [Flavobacteriales bacterium]